MSGQWSEAVRVTWAWYEALRRAGLTPDELFVAVARNVGLGGALTSFVEARRSGRVFKVGAALTPDPEAFEAEWWCFATALITGTVPDETLRAWWDDALTGTIDPAALAVALLNKEMLYTSPVGAS